MKRNQALWLLLASAAIYFGSIYCGHLLATIDPRLAECFGGRPLPDLSQWPLDGCRFVAAHGKWIAGLLVALAAVSFWRNSKPNAADERRVAVLNAVGYYAARGVLLFLVLLAILQTHGMLIALLDLDRQNHGYHANMSQSFKATYRHNGEGQLLAPDGSILNANRFRVRSQLIDTPPRPKDALYEMAPLK